MIQIEGGSLMILLAILVGVLLLWVNRHQPIKENRNLLIAVVVLGYFWLDFSEIKQFEEIIEGIKILVVVALFITIAFLVVQYFIDLLRSPIIVKDLIITIAIIAIVITSIFFFVKVV